MPYVVIMKEKKYKKIRTVNALLRFVYFSFNIQLSSL